MTAAALIFSSIVNELNPMAMQCFCSLFTRASRRTRSSTSLPLYSYVTQIYTVLHFPLQSPLALPTLLCLVLFLTSTSSLRPARRALGSASVYYAIYTCRPCNMSHVLPSRTCTVAVFHVWFAYSRVLPSEEQTKVNFSRCTDHMRTSTLSRPCVYYIGPFPPSKCTCSCSKCRHKLDSPLTSRL